MICTKDECEEEMTWTAIVPIEDLFVEVMLCDTHFQQFIEKYEDINSK